VEYEFYDKKFNSEGRFICLEFELFYLVATYVPNAGQNLDRLEERTQEWDRELRNVPPFFIMLVFMPIEKRKKGDFHWGFKLCASRN